MKTLLIAALFFAGSLSAAAADVAQGAGAPASDSPLETIRALDVHRYMGTWFEIAKYPNVFQRNYAGGTKADYSLMDEGRVRVVIKPIASALGAKAWRPYTCRGTDKAPIPVSCPNWANCSRCLATASVSLRVLN